MQHPRREHAVRPLGRERLHEPVAARLEQLAGERRGPGAAEPAVCLEREREAGHAPELRAEQAEGEVGVREEPLQHIRPLRSELARILPGVAEQECRRAVRKSARRRQIGVEVLEASRGEVVRQLRMRCAAHPQRMPRAEHVVEVAGHCELLRPDAAPEPVVALEHADAPAGVGEQGAARERVLGHYMPGPEVPPHSSGARSAIDCENVHRWPPGSSAVYCRSP